MISRLLPVLGSLIILTLTSYPVFSQNSADEVTNSADQSDTLYVREMVLAQDVVERTPIDVVQAFDVSDGEAWAFARIFNTGPLRNVIFKWYYEESLYYTFEAKVGTSKNWRTYSSVTLREGAWRVEMEDHKGNQLKEIRFHVSE